ncbi:hypothetical protein [Streptomyces sp. NPDC089919]|uniref:hypothetical protein n=1 Tax=Streptomyces sp. NPDC089919 TaxID=3155188 RepID=UPI003420FA3C
MHTRRSPAAPGTRPARVLSPAGVLGCALLLTPMLCAGPAYAHGDTLHIVITGHRMGHVTADVTWENDGDPLDEPLSATVSATSADGSRTAGPWLLVPGTTPASWTTAEVLPPGSWQVTVEAGFPSLGRATGRVSVPVVDPIGMTRPSATTTASDGAAAAASGGVGDRPDSGWNAVRWVAGGFLLSSLAAAVAGALHRRRRTRPAAGRRLSAVRRPASR